MTLTDRDRKLLLILAPVACFAIYWLMLLNPALDRRAGLEKPMQQAQAERDEAVAEAQQVTQAKANYEKDYAELVKLSKAIPQSVAIADLMRELNAAASGMDIDFSNITMVPDAAAAAEAAETAGAPRRRRSQALTRSRSSSPSPAASSPCPTCSARSSASCAPLTAGSR